MKYSVLVIMLLIYVNLTAQECNHNEIPNHTLNNLNEMGIDEEPLLNSNESAFLNAIFKDKLDGFDFVNKKVAFVQISSENGKVHYFEMHKKYFVDNNQACDNGTLYVFNASQKEESGDYDAAIVYWSKFLLPIDQLVKKLKD